MINKIEWDTAYSIGHEEVDSQHKELITLTNQLFLDMAQGVGVYTLEGIMKRLKNFVAEHFVAEEMLMEKYAYPEMDEHKRKHQEFTERFAEYENRLQRGDHRFALDLYRYLSNWLNDHFLSEDQKFGAFLDRQLERELDREGDEQNEPYKSNESEEDTDSKSTE